MNVGEKELLVFITIKKSLFIYAFCILWHSERYWCGSCAPCHQISCFVLQQNGVATVCLPQRFQHSDVLLHCRSLIPTHSVSPKKWKRAAPDFPCAQKHLIIIPFSQLLPLPWGHSWFKNSTGVYSWLIPEEILMGVATC